MSTYLRHYWSLFADFTEAFSSVRYKNIPLPILANFYQYLNDDIKLVMKQSEFHAVLQNVILDNKRIQPLFDPYIKPLSSEKRKRSTSRGKILVNGTYHRFQPSVFLEHFDPNTTLILSRGKPYMGIPIVTLSHYETDITAWINLCTEQVNELLIKLQTHPVFGQNHFRQRWLDDIPRMLKALISVEKMLESHAVSCVLVGTTEDLISRVLTLTAASLGVPSVCLQHGVIMGEEAFLPVFATKQAVYGQYERDWYMSRGVHPDAITITGHPRYDVIFTDNHKSDAAATAGQLKINEQAFNILMITQPQTNKRLFTQAVNLLARIPNVEILIKAHPWEEKKGYTEEYEKLAKEHLNVTIVTAKMSLYGLLQQIDLVVMENSTVGLEAMLFDKLVIVYHDPQSERHYEYYDHLSPYIYSTPEELVNIIHTAIHNPILQNEIKAKIKQFLHYSYPIPLSGLTLMKLLNKLSDHIAMNKSTILQEGMLIKGSKAEISIIDNGLRRLIPSIKVFQQLGYKWEDVYQVDDRIIERIPKGLIIHE